MSKIGCLDLVTGITTPLHKIYQQQLDSILFQSFHLFQSKTFYFRNELLYNVIYYVK